MTDGGGQRSFLLDEVSVVRLPNTRAHTILGRRLYLGPKHAAANEASVKADGITHILNVTKEIPKQHYFGVTVRHLQCYDSPQQRLPFEEATMYIDQCLDDEGGRCLVHCNAGQSRSASIIIYYLMTKGHTLKQSYEYVKERKPDIRPNFGFISQLQREEVRLLGVPSLEMDQYKMDTLCEILEGSCKTREDVWGALKKAGGDGEVALGMLLE